MGISSRSQAPPGNALPARLCLAMRPGQPSRSPDARQSLAAVRSQAEPGNEGHVPLSTTSRRPKTTALVTIPPPHKTRNMPEVLDWQRDDPMKVIVRAVDLLRQGQFVVVPSDTVYAVLASALDPAAVERLQHFAQAPPMVSLTDAHEVPDWLPYLDGLGLRLARHCWPGPLALRSGAALAGLVRRLPPSVQDALLRDGCLTLRVSGHAIMDQIARQFAGPIAFAELANVKTPEEALAMPNMAMIVQDGPAYFGQPATIVQVDGRKYQIVSEGVLGPNHLAELAICRVLFVCTGNTCRSPLAMALCRKLLAEQLGCTPAELPAHGFQVLSAGMAAIMGEPASAEAVDIARLLGADLDEHRSQPLSADLLAQADCLFTMTNAHLRMLQSLSLDFGPPARLLAADGTDVVDPIGCDADVYRHCAQKITACLEQRSARDPGDVGSP